LNQIDKHHLRSFELVDDLSMQPFLSTLASKSQFGVVVSRRIEIVDRPRARYFLSTVAVHLPLEGIVKAALLPSEEKVEASIVHRSKAI